MGGLGLSCGVCLALQSWDMALILYAGAASAWGVGDTKSSSQIGGGVSGEVEDEIVYFRGDERSEVAGIGVCSDEDDGHVKMPSFVGGDDYLCVNY